MVLKAGRNFLLLFLDMFRLPTKEAIEKEMSEEFRYEDPWHFRTSVFERKRFQTLLDYIKQVPHASILEAGCAEGFFTKMLLEICDDVTTFDISDVALKRARKYAPGAKYLKASLEEFETKRKFDVIICSEVIYYTYDRKKVLDKLRRYGKYLVASNVVLHKFRPSSAELIFHPLPFPKFKFVFTLKEMKLAIITLRNLQTEDPMTIKQK